MDTKQVVVAYDFSDTADIALARAAELACRAPQHVLHVIAAIDPRVGFGLESGEQVDYHYADKVHDHLAERVRAAIDACGAAGLEVQSTCTRGSAGRPRRSSGSRRTWGRT